MEITEQTEKTEYTEISPWLILMPEKYAAFAINHRNGQKTGITSMVTIITQMVRIPPTRK